MTRSILLVETIPHCLRSTDATGGLLSKIWQYSQQNTLAHELESKKMGIWLRHVDKTWYGFLEPQDVYFLEKYDQLPELVAFGQKLRYFTDQNWLKGGPHENEFWVFSNTKWMLQTIRAEKVDEKMGLFV